MAKAKEWLRAKGILKADKRSGKATGQGVIKQYIHQGKIGALVEVNCETDFVARTDDFQDFANKMAMQIVQLPTVVAVSKDKIPKKVIEKERQVIADSED